MTPDRKRFLQAGFLLWSWPVLLAAAAWAGRNILKGGIIGLFLIAAIGLYFVYCLFAAILWAAILGRKREFLECRGEDILIVAPHPDDCVAIAGGYAIQTLGMGGRVTVVYATDGYENGGDHRRAEAIDAWRIAGLGADRIHFLDHPVLTGFTGRAELERCTEEIAGWILRAKPDIVFVPLYEGGHFQHDAVNYMASHAAGRTGFKGTIYEAPEYNFFLSFRTTPEKILSGLLRFIPLVRHDYPPEPVGDGELLHLRMTPEQIERKKEMLSRFRSQHPDQLVRRFGFEDRYQRRPERDYSRPPFEYDRSAARILDGLKGKPLIGGLFSRMFIWTRTIHPDPEYTMTRIPDRTERPAVPRGPE
jgi:LmbE family N-acetylglucosaminyl deacetylase